jgi:hypothetical protein
VLHARSVLSQDCGTANAQHHQPTLELSFPP